MKIDLVYTWVDGSDPIWIEKRSRYLPQSDQRDIQSFCKGRLCNSNELLYSLRSVEMYAPWINHIFIITDRQVPLWLDTTHEKITIVDHNDILPQDVLPLFNSNAIEQCLHKIEGLSEHFLYANDDMMFGHKVSPDFFFNAKGLPISRVNYEVIKDDNVYCDTILKVNKKINSDFLLECINWTPSHQIDAYLKSSISSCLECYNEWSDRTLRSRFRSKEDMQRHIFTLWGIVKNKAEILVMKEQIPFVRKPYIYSFLRFPKLIFIYLGLIKGVDSLKFDLYSKNILAKIKFLKPRLICLNDSELASDKDRINLRSYLKVLYPKRSSFELQK